MLKVVPGAYCRVVHAGNVPLHNPGFVLDDAMPARGRRPSMRAIVRNTSAQSLI